MTLPELKQLQGIDRRLTSTEYYHASIGRNPRSHIRSHEVVFVLEGSGSIDPAAWRNAIDRAVAVNPGARLRLVGKRQRARWVSDGLPPQLQVIDDVAWDGRSSEGLDKLFAHDLALEAGKTSELLIVGPAAARKVIFRVSHAVMDGLGVAHFLQELFRALRDEPLLGSNATFTDTELMRHMSTQHVVQPGVQPSFLTGGAQGEARGGIWRRLSIAGPQPHLLPRLLAALADYSRQHSDWPIRIALPSNLRRHVPNLLATMNFAGMTYLDLPGDRAVSVDEIKQRLKELQDSNADVCYRKIYDLLCYLPFRWIDGLVSITDKNFTAPIIHETAALSMIGAFKKHHFSGGGFSAERLYVLPQLENVFVTVVGLQGNFEFCVGMPRVFASNGRMAALLDFLETRLSRGEASPAA